MTSADHEHVEMALLRRSRMMALVLWVGGIGAASLRSSRAMGRVRRLRREFLALTLAERIRYIAVTVGVAASGHAFLLVFVPVRLRPALPTIVWIVVAGASAAIAMTAPALAVAWRARSSRWRGCDR